MSWLGIGALLSEQWSPFFNIHLVASLVFGWYLDDLVQILIGDVGKTKEK